jgi:hypothetical protein
MENDRDDARFHCLHEVAQPATGPHRPRPDQILLVAAKRTPDLARSLSTVIDAYNTQFHQQSIGLITRDSCAAF